MFSGVDNIDVWLERIALAPREYLQKSNMIVIKSSLPSSGYTQKYKEAFTMYCQNKNYLISLKNTELHTTSKSFLNLPNPMPLTDHISLISLPVVVSSCISCTQFSSVVVVHTLLLRLVFINTQVLIITITTITVATNQVPYNLISIYWSE